MLTNNHKNNTIQSKEGKNMSDFERQKKILEILEDKKRVSTNKLVKMLYVSPATIRRELESMSKRGLLKRIHGGAILVSSGSEESALEIREETNKKEKKTICEKCIEFIKSNQSLFLDSSSTVSTISQYLNDFQNLTIITNGVSAALQIAQKTNFKVFVPGGFIRSQSNSILGDCTNRSLSNIYCDVFISSCAGFEIGKGITEATIENAETKKIMIKNSQMRILLIDSSKFGKTYLAKTCDISDIDIIITEKKPDQKYIDFISQFDTKLIVCED